MKEHIRRVLRRLGFEVTRYRVETVPLCRMGALISHHRIDLVLDVGANQGQYALELRAAGYRGRIVSFEPLPEAHRKCVAAAASDSSWQVAPRTALGRTAGHVALHVSGNSFSSSVLAMNPLHAKVAPASRYVGTETVPLARLDSFPELLSGARRPLLKVDTQGYEAEVLAGATEVMPRIHGLQLELSLVPLYDGAPLLHDLLPRLRELGFELEAILPGFTDPQSGRMLQVDGMFFRPSRDNPSAVT